MSSLPDLSELSSAQKDALIGQLWAQNQLLSAQLALLQERIKPLEARLKLNSRNSSKPPSSDGLAKPAPKSLRLAGQRPVGGQKGHEGNTLRQSVQVDEVVTHPGSAACLACQGPWARYEVMERRQVFELPVLRAQVYEGRWPDGVNAPTQYGPRANALVVHLNKNHLRELTFVQEQSADKAFNGWAQEMKALLVQANEEVKQAGAPLTLKRQSWFEAQ